MRTHKRDGFLISEDGLVIGRSGKPLKAKISADGYLRVRLQDNWKNLHRLLAEAFIPNPTNLETVNHKDGNKLNNNLQNLEWVSRQDNLYHAMDHYLHAWGRTKIKDSYGNIYKSQAEAARIIGGCQGNIKRAIDTGGHYYHRRWSYA